MYCGDYYGWDWVPVIIMGALFIALTITVAVVIKTWIYCMIFRKAGYCWAWGLLTLVPVAHIIMPFVLALGDWPVRRELRRLKEQPAAPAPQAG